MSNAVEMEATPADELAGNYRWDIEDFLAELMFCRK
jgi:hypothetical protein